jgi:hypothetical protein
MGFLNFYSKWAAMNNQKDMALKIIAKDSRQTDAKIIEDH